MFVPLQGVHTRTPLPYTIYALLFISLAVIVTALLGEGRYQQKNMVEGVVRKGLYVSAMSASSGTVTAIFVSPGQQVKAGQVIAEISSNISDALDAKSRPITEQLIESTQSLLHDLEVLKKDTQSKLNATLTTAHGANQHSASAKEHLGRAITNAQEYEQNVARQATTLEDLVNKGAARGVDLDRMRMSLHESAVKTNQLMQSLHRLRQDDSQIAGSLIEHEGNWRMQLENIDKSILEVRSRLHDLQRQNVTAVLARHDGQVDSILVHEGEDVKANQQLILLQKHATKQTEIVLMVDDVSIGMIDPAQPLIVRFTSFPYQTYGVLKAQITHIPSSAIMKTDLKSGEKATYPIVARLLISRKDKIPAAALINGMAVTAYVSQPPLSLFEWMMLPIKKAFIRNPSE
ncbi:HlyD family secretion protein [Methylophilus luteus]|uniref:HlyD family secretion protein n=1 Tax=Methylophilus luteus TaxID=640108 RepID=A0ABW3FAM6_9PROT